MKNKLLSISIAILLSFVLQQRGIAAVAHSRAEGGPWNEASTWIEYFVPGPSDTAYITGPVGIGSVVGYETYNSFAGRVVVESNGHLFPVDYGGGLGIFTLFIDQDIVNNGLLTNEGGPDGDELLKLVIKGNITNNNEWKVYQTELSGNENQNLSLSAGKSFGGYWKRFGGFPLTTTTDLWFDCKYIVSGNSYTGDFDLNGSTLHMQNHSIRSTGTLIYNGCIEGDFDIRGIFRVNKYVEDTLVFQGNVTVTDTLESTEYGGGYGIQKLRIEGNIINNGVVRDREDVKNADDLNILITGNITNNGKWTCNYVNFIGSEPQYISQSPGTCFVSSFYDLDASSPVVAGSDITLSQNCYLNGSTLNMQGNQLTLLSWLFNGTLSNAHLRGGYLQSVTAEEMLNIHGLLTADNYNVFNCPVVVEDTLRSNTYGGGSCYFDLTVNGTITNNGLIENWDPGHWLRIYCTGNVINNGTWANAATIFNGNQDQTIEQAEGTSFACDLESQKTAGDLIGLSNLDISGNINLNNSLFRMEGRNLVLHNWIYNGLLDNATTYGGKMQNLTVTGKLNIHGTLIADENVTLNCNVAVYDTLQCNTYGGGSKFYDVIINGSLSNYGRIQSWGSGMLRLYVSGDLLNAGTWVNHLTQMNVSGDQTIELIDNLPITGPVTFEAMPESGTYQWFFNDVVLDSPDFSGASSKVLTWNVPVSSDWYGVFSCETGSRERVSVTLKEAFTNTENHPACNARIWSSGKSVSIDWQEESAGEACIVDLTGRCIAGFRLEKGINIRQVFLPGLYLVQVKTGNKSSCEKLLLQ